VPERFWLLFHGSWAFLCEESESRALYTGIPEYNLYDRSGARWLVGVFRDYNTSPFRQLFDILFYMCLMRSQGNAVTSPHSSRCWRGQGKLDNFTQVSHCLSWDLNWASPEYKSEALPPEPTSLVRIFCRVWNWKADCSIMEML
jgi:hypothetical protein